MKTYVRIGITAVCAMAFGALNAKDCQEEYFEGEATYYGGVAGTDGGNCGIFVGAADWKHCAMNHEQYDNSNACGACVEIEGPKGKVKIKVVDQCPECKHGDIDMTPDAFAQISPLNAGRVKIKWKYVPCDEEKGMTLKLDPGSSAYYFKMAVYGHRYALKKVEFLSKSGEYVEIPRTDYNYFVAMSGIDEGSNTMGEHTFRITAVSGESVIVTGVSFAESETFQTDAQFALTDCDESGINAPTSNGDFAAPYDVYSMDGRYAGIATDLEEWGEGERGVYVVVSRKSGERKKMILGR